MNFLFGYLFGSVAAPNAQDTARRATLAQFQTYPANSVEGAGQLVTQNGVTGGKYWQITQPPQVYANHTPVIADLLGTGQMAVGIGNAPLIKNNDTIGV
jgi:hypothetical protein